jgi:hypothetical protein
MVDDSSPSNLTLHKIIAIVKNKSQLFGIVLIPCCILGTSYELTALALSQILSFVTWANSKIWKLKLLDVAQA